MNPSPQQLDEIAARRRTPIATYRLQFNREFTFAQAQVISEYLTNLGITDVYASPLFLAGPESTHGYDICSFEQLNPALGSREEFDAFSGRLHELGLGLILDMVPNHMGNDLSNCWWNDVLKHGPRSPFASFFDIDWQPSQPDLHRKVLVPALEDHYARVLEAGKLKLIFEDGTFAIAYYERKFPVAPACYPDLLSEIVGEVRSRAEGDALIAIVHEYGDELTRRQGAAELLPADSLALQEQLRSWHQASPAFRGALERVLEAFNGVPGKPASFDHLHALLERQHYRLAFWRTGLEEINYRRFFDVTALVSVRMELDVVFQACHQLVFELLHSGRVTGLRIDHPDGLWDPKNYFRRLQAGFLLTEAGERLGSPSEAAVLAVSNWLTDRLDPLERSVLHHPLPPPASQTLEAPRNDPLAGKAPHPRWPVYVLAEKILTGDEPLRQDWSIEGTTGYDFLNQVNGLFVESANEETFTRCYEDFSGNRTSFPDLVYEAKAGILADLLASELTSLTCRLKRLAERTRYGKDFPLRQIRQALAGIIAAFPVYRSYVSERTVQVGALERFHIEQAIAEVKRRIPTLEMAVLDFIQDLLLLRAPADYDNEAKQQQREFVARFQQLTGPVTAKGLEDTSFYRYNRLVSLNEVGGEPARFGVSPEAFHEHNMLKAEQWPHALLATATHDTKRGEDVRARINVLSEIPGEWDNAVRLWAQMNAGCKTLVGGSPAPSPNDEWLLYQTLVGVWPFLPNGTTADYESLRQRMTAHMQKATKEAKVHTSWTDSNAAYERATEQFVQRILSPQKAAEFLSDFVEFQKRIAFFGQFNSLAQVVLKIASPGVPDFYQSTELWDFSLVDPDNRRPVDYALRQRLFEELRKRADGKRASLTELAQELLERSHTGEVKLYAMFQALSFRKRHSELFRDGDYVPLYASGSKREHVCAFARRLAGQTVVAVVPRLVVRLAEGKRQAPRGAALWQDTRLELALPGLPGRFRDVFTGQEVTSAPGAGGPSLLVSAVLDLFPVALLERV
ncbi:MAG: malto-oligosyltrehalose synthase [Verrucomicrobiia bacterium]